MFLAALYFAFLPLPSRNNAKTFSLGFEQVIMIIIMLTMNSLYAIIMSRTSFRVNPHSIACLNVKELLARSRCLSVHSRTKCLWVRISLLSLKLQIKPVWLNDWVFVYALSGCGFESRLLSLVMNWLVICLNDEGT